MPLRHKPKIGPLRDYAKRINQLHHKTKNSFNTTQLPNFQICKGVKSITQYWQFYLYDGSKNVQKQLKVRNVKISNS